MSGSPSVKGYGPSSRWQRLCFDGDERKFEQWLIKFLGYMRLQKLKDVIDPPAATNTTNMNNSPSNETTDTDDSITITTDSPTADVEKNALAFAELIQFLDDRNNLVNSMSLGRNYTHSPASRPALSLFNVAGG